MSSVQFFIIFIPILAVILIVVNFSFAQHKPDKNKDAQFECGFISFVQMSRMAFTISFFIYALLFLLFDLEILLVYPYVVSAYDNDLFGLIVVLIFFLLLTIGFIYELGTKALLIDSRQTREINKAHKFILFTLKSSALAELAILITQLDSHMIQLTDFISQFNTTITTLGINVITDATGNLSIEVPLSMSDTDASTTSKRIGILDRLINTRSESITDLLQKGKGLEDSIKLTDPNYKSQLAEKILEFKKINDSYNH
jgi:NADH-ubiquinone oxidoreductase chain 3